jgi:hypothetical protein
MATRPRATNTEQAQEAADWPTGMPYTVYFPRRGGFATADIEYTAPLPRIGDTVEFIDATGAHHLYSVTDVVHTLQNSPAPATGGIPLLRAGIPAVYLARTRRKPHRRAP